MQSAVWPAGAATGVGSLPGTNIVDATTMVFGELPDLPHLPELPGRGPGADLIGRGAALLTDLPVELYAGRWRVAAHTGRDLRRAWDLAERDLDALTDAADEYEGPLKLQAAGPFTLAASLELNVGGALLRDHGAVRDLVGSLADGLANHVREVVRRIPHASIVMQLDEPSLPAVLAGRIPTESGLATLRAVRATEVRDALTAIVAAVGAAAPWPDNERSPVPVVVHCCAPGLPLDLVREAGARGASIDVTQLDKAAMDGIGTFVDAGLTLFAGIVAATPMATEAGDARKRATGAAKAAKGGAKRTAKGSSSPVDAAVTELSSLWSRIGFAPELLPQRVVVTPTCGLAGATPAYARAAMKQCVETARRLLDPAEAGVHR
jgi:hypothetical protein